MKQIQQLREENKALRETCEVLGNKKVMKDIKKSLKEIKSGKFLPLSDL